MASDATPPVAGANPSVRGRIRWLELAGDPALLGATHGAAHAEEIRRYAEGRVDLASNGAWSGRVVTRDAVLGLAESMIPAHRRYAPALFDEMEAMARACGLSVAEAIIVGGFTDFVDAVRGRAGDAWEEDDCTAVLVPGGQSDGRAFLAQTWDMHEDATEHVVMLDVRPARGPRALVFSTLGCLGQIGVNEAGIAVGINNLTASDGRVGVTWPFVVRKVLAQTSLEAALACVTEADLAGAHNYLLLDGGGRGFSVEAMPSHRHVEELGTTPLVHTNHCLDPLARSFEAEKAAALRDSSETRLRRAEKLLTGARVDVEFLMALTRDAEAICQRSKPPHHIESSGAMIMRPASREFWAVWGIPAENEYAHFSFDS